MYERLKRWLDPDAFGGDRAELRGVVLAARDHLERAYTQLSEMPEIVLEDVVAPDPEPADPSKRSQEEGAAMQAYRTGQKQLAENDWLGALISFERAAELCPNVGEYRACVGWGLYLVYGTEETKLREAIAHAKAGMKLAPEHYHPALVLGRLYQCTSRLDLATRALERAVHLNPQSVEAVRELRIMRQCERHEGKGRKKRRRRG